MLEELFLCEEVVEWVVLVPLLGDEGKVPLEVAFEDFRGFETGDCEGRTVGGVKIGCPFVLLGTCHPTPPGPITIGTVIPWGSTVKVVKEVFKVVKDAYVVS